ncbi:MAG: STAS/SEC14 domain-containing protein [Burkholderiales bacterium]|nr:STAS/SEC14 domain-containing protein [Burkholderiales bacterium]
MKEQHTGAPMQAHVSRLPDYVDVELSGHVDLDKLLELIGKLGALTQGSGDSRLLFDLLRLEGEVHLASQMQVGEQVVLRLGHLARVASVVPADKITRASEQVARAHGVQLKIFDSRDAAVAWLLEEAPAPGVSAATATATVLADPACDAIWSAVRHLFPLHAQAIQLPNGTLAISWAITNTPGAVYDMATPITVRLEPALEQSMREADAEGRKQLALQQEAAFRAGLMGYDPYTSVPKARVIVLG